MFNLETKSKSEDLKDGPIINNSDIIDFDSIPEEDSEELEFDEEDEDEDDK